MAKHLVTGASGFLGSQIVEKLYGMGERDIIAHDILENKNKIKGVQYVCGDILNRSELIEVSQDVDYIHHNAALVPITKAGDDFHKVNVVGTRNVLECCRKHNVKKLVHVSSSAIYGSSCEEVPITEKTEYKPVEIYGQSKLDAEKEVWNYMREGGGASCIRPRTTIGGKSRLGIFQILFEWIYEGVNVYVIGDGTNLFQFVHVDDLIDACIKAAYSDSSGLYNIGTDRYRTLREDLEGLIAYAGTGSRVKSLPVGLARFALHAADVLRISPLAPYHYLTYHKPYVFDISKAINELRWKPQYSSIEALIESYEWYLSNKDHLNDASASVHKKPLGQGILKLLKLIS